MVLSPWWSAALQRVWSSCRKACGLSSVSGFGCKDPHRDTTKEPHKKVPQGDQHLVAYLAGKTSLPPLSVLLSSELGQGGWSF